jgi:hypothetical protein
VHRFGNARFDHSLVVVAYDARARRGPGDRPPVRVWFDAAGAFDAAEWEKLEVTKEARANNPLLDGCAKLRPERLSAGPVAPRANAAADVSADLLRDTGAASAGCRNQRGVADARRRRLSRRHAHELVRALRVLGAIDRVRSVPSPHVVRLSLGRKLDERERALALVRGQLAALPALG